MLFVIITAALAGILSAESTHNKDCAEPPTIPFARIEKTSTNHGSYAIYAFQDPYKLMGYLRVQCLSGEWVNMPSCNDGTCDINNLTHSSHISREETPRYVHSGQDLHVTCKAGYSPSLVAPHCLDGVWTRNSMSPCREDDCLVSEVEHGYIIENVYGELFWDWWKARYVREVMNKTVPVGTIATPGTVYYLHCLSGYSFQGLSGTKRPITCTEANWHPDPVCIPRGVITPVIHGTERQPKNNYATPRSERLGSSPNVEIESEIQCPLLETNTTRGSFKIHYENNRKVHSVAKYACNSSTQKLIGRDSRLCMSSGKWSGSFLSCKDITCPRIVPNNSLVVAYTNDDKVNSTATFRCDRNAKLNGENSAICMPNGQWSNSIPTCENYVSCDKFEISENLEVLYSNDVNVGSIATFSCLSPYTLVGSHQARCLQSGTWDRASPSCEATVCSIGNLFQSLPETVFPDLRNVTEDYADYVPYGTELQFFCERNSFVSGDQKARCGRQGRWEHGVVRCIQGCVLGEKKPQLLFEPIKEYYLFGETVIFSCPPRQELNSEVQRVMCLGTSWSDPIPDCIETVYRGK